MNHQNLCQIHYQTIDDVPKHGFTDTAIRKKKIKKPDKYNWREFYTGLTLQSLKFIVLLLNGKYIGIVCIDLKMSIKTFLTICHHILFERNLIKNIGLHNTTFKLSMNQQEPFYIISDLYNTRLLLNLSPDINIYQIISVIWNLFNHINYIV